MSLFKLPFLSFGGQIERLSNVVNVISNSIGITKGGVVANVDNPILKTTLEAVGNHPFITAGAIAVPISFPSAVSTIAKGALAHPILAIASVVGLGVASQSQKGASAIVNAPSNLVGFGQDIGKFIDNPSLQTGSQIVSDHPFISGAIALTGAYGATKLLASPLSTFGLTQATQAQTQAMQVQSQLATSSPLEIVSEGEGAITTPNYPKSITAKKKKKSKKKVAKKKKKSKKKVAKKKAKKKTIKRRKTKHK